MVREDIKLSRYLEIYIYFLYDSGNCRNSRVKNLKLQANLQSINIAAYVIISSTSRTSGCGV